MVYEGCNGRSKKASNSVTNNDNFKRKGVIRCFYCDKVSYIKRHCHKVKEPQRNKKNNKDTEGKEDTNVIDYDLAMMCKTRD